MKRVKLDKRALVLSIFTLITILTWIGFEVFWTVKKTTITKATKQQMTTLNPQINTELIQSLKNSLSFSGNDLNTVNIIKISTESANLEE